jgi:hypothetical protein
MISSICASNRPAFIPRVVAQWQAQTCSDRELVIVQNADESPAPVPAGIVSVIAPAGTLLGAKLNLGIAAAHGGLFHKWDDDDLYAPGFLARGVAALADGKNDFCTWTRNLVQFPAETRVISWFGVGGSSIFTRKLAAKCPYRNAASDVDGGLVQDMRRDGFRAAGVNDSPALFTYVRDGQNLWKTMPWGEPVDDYLMRCSDLWRGK